MRQRVDADAELADGIGLLEQFAVDATRAQHQRSGKAPDAASDDDCLHARYSNSNLPSSTSPRLRGEVGSPTAIRVRGYRSINSHQLRGESPSPRPSPRE